MINRNPSDQGDLELLSAYNLRDSGENPEAAASQSQEIQVAGLGSAITRTLMREFGQTGLVKKKTKDIFDSMSARRKMEEDGPAPEDLDRILMESKVADEALPPEGDPLTLGDDSHLPVADEVPGGLPMPEEGTAAKVLEGYQDAPPVDVVADKRTDQRNINVQRHHEGGIANKRLAEMDPDVALSKMKSADDVAKLLDVVGSLEPAAGVRTNKSLEEATQNMDQVRNILQSRFGADPATVGLMNDKQLLASRKMLSTLGADVVTLADKVAEGDRTPATLLAYEKKAEAFVALQRYTQGQVKQVARALQQQNIIAETLNSGSVEAIMELVDGGGTRARDTIAKHAANLSKEARVNPDTALIKQFKPRVLRDGIRIAAEYWTNNILSGVQTHVVNTMGTATVQAWESLVIKPVAAAIGETRRAAGIGERDDYVSADETLAGIWSGVAGVRDGLRLATETLISGKSQIGSEKSTNVKGAIEETAMYVGGRLGGETGEKMGKAVADASTLSFRLLQAEDAYGKTLAFRSELTALAVRDGLAAGKSGQSLDQHVKGVLDDPSDELYDAAMTKSKEITMTTEDQRGVVGVIARSLKRLSAEVPAFKFLTPFINTPANLVHYGLQSSILAGLDKELRGDLAAGGARADVAQAKLVTGLAVTGSVFAAYQAGNLTGNGPKDYKLRKTLERTGWQPNSIRIGNKYYSYRRTDPFAMSIAGVVDQLDQAAWSREESSVQKHIVAGGFSIAKHTLDATFMSGMRDLLDTIDDPSRVDKWIASYAQGFVPYSSALKSASRVTNPHPVRMDDDGKYETGFTHHVSMKMKEINPMLYQDLRPARYWDGSPIVPEGGAMVYAISPYAVSTLKDDRATKELATNGIAPAEPSPMLRTHGMEFSLLSMDEGAGGVYDKLVKRVGIARREAVNATLKHEQYSKMDKGPQSARADKLRSVIAKAAKVATNAFLKEDLKDILESDPKAAQAFADQVGGLDNAERFMNALRSPGFGETPVDNTELSKKKGALPVPTMRGEKAPITNTMPRF